MKISRIRCTSLLERKKETKSRVAKVKTGLKYIYKKCALFWPLFSQDNELHADNIIPIQN